jgi:hypothetical protein
MVAETVGELLGVAETDDVDDIEHVTVTVGVVVIETVDEVEADVVPDSDKLGETEAVKEFVGVSDDEKLRDGVMDGEMDTVAVTEGAQNLTASAITNFLVDPTLMTTFELASKSKEPRLFHVPP